MEQQGASGCQAEGFGLAEVFCSLVFTGMHGAYPNQMLFMLYQLVTVCYLSPSLNLKCQSFSPCFPQELCFIYSGNPCLVVLQVPCSILHESFWQQPSEIWQLVTPLWIISPLRSCLLSFKHAHSKPHTYFGMGHLPACAFTLSFCLFYLPLGVLIYVGIYKVENTAGLGLKREAEASKMTI